MAGRKFRRQHAIGRFVVDFYCPKAALVVEYTREQDAARQEFLESLGLRVVRVTNDQVRDDMPWILRMIAAALATRR